MVLHPLPTGPTYANLIGKDPTNPNQLNYSASQILPDCELLKYVRGAWCCSHFVGSLVVSSGSLFSLVRDSPVAAVDWGVCVTVRALVSTFG